MKFCLLQHILKVLVFLSFNLFGPITKTSSKFKPGISIVSNTFEQNLNVGYDLVFISTTGPLSLKPSFHMIAHDRRITENTASDRQ